MFSNHVTQNISAYCHGELNADESRSFTEHVLACLKCRSKFEEIKLGIKFAEQLPQVSAPESLWRDIESKLGTDSATIVTPRLFLGTWKTQVAAFAVVLLTVAVVGYWWTRREKK